MFKSVSSLVLAGLLALGVVLSPAPPALAQSKISNLAALAGGSVAADDLFAIVDTSAGVTKKITADELRKVFGLTRIRLRVYMNAVQSITTSSTTDVIWTAKGIDPNGIFTAPSSIISVPADVSECSINSIAWWASNSTSSRYHTWEHRNSSGTVLRILASDIRTAIFETVSTLKQDWFSCTPGDRLVMTARQNSGGNVNLFGAASGGTAGNVTEATLSFR